MTVEINSNEVKGLSQQEANELLKYYGPNKLSLEDKSRLFSIITGLVKEPMFLLLVVACTLYFILGENMEALMMAAAMIIMTAISVFEEIRSGKAMNALRELTEPGVLVIRDNKETRMGTDMLVPGDIVLLEEGEKVPADAEILKANDLSVNESVLTGEAFPVEKSR